MSLKEIVRQKLLTEVIKYQAPVQTQQHPAAPLRPGRKIEWRVLVVDNLSMRMVSSCCKMHEISNERITLVENINKSREPLSNMDAVYLITPTDASIKSMLRDFENPHSPMYRYAHVFFTQAVPDELFRLISSQKEFVKKYLKTCKEVNIAFIPYEEKVFSLGSPATFQYLYSPGLAWNRAKHIERIAEQIATVCATLGEYPMIRYRAAGYSNSDLAVAVQHKLDGYKVDEPTLGDGPEKSRSQLLILDRGFDCVSPLLHELTLQAMAYDLLEIENDVYTYTPGPNSPTKEVLLDEGDELWMQLRHKHIVHVNKIVASNLKRFNDSNPMVLADKASIQDLSLLIKKMPQHQKQFTKYATHFHLAEDCMKSQNYVHKLCRIEQDLAMGYDAKGEKIKDHLSNIVPLLLDQSISNKDKVRIIALYVMAKNGVSEENLSKLFMHAGLCPKEQAIVRNLNYLGVNVFGTNRNEVYTVPRKDHITDQTLQVSRWTPVIKDVMEDCIDDTLDKRYFPFLSRRLSNSTYQVPVSARYATWRSVKGKGSTVTKNLPRLIIFVVGGISMSEMRCAYEVTRERKTWEVIVGSSEILTPEAFMSNLGNLHE